MIRTEHRDDLAVVRMEHGKVNALSQELCERLDETFRELAQSPSRAVVLTGHGSVFSAGVDLLRVLDGGPAYIRPFLETFHELCGTLFGFPKPLVAAINGHAIAGGCVLACTADRRLLPFIAGISPTVMQMDSWQELTNPRDLTKIFQTAEYAAWRSLREAEDSRYIGLAMPRFLARLPYGAKTDPVEEFDFEEDTEGADHTKYTWANSAYAMATNITKSFKMWGWCSRIRGIESGGAVEGLPTHTFPTDDGGVDMKCPTEIAITDRREAELAKNGFMPLLHKKNSDFAAFIGAQSLQKPTEYDDPDATANANLAARLPYLFATCRFAHYLKCIVRDKIGSFKEREDMEMWLNKWIMQYVDGDPANSSEATKARKPLAAAEVTVQEVEGNPGYYASRFYLRPHYQLEGLTVSLRLVSKLPSVKGA